MTAFNRAGFAEHASLAAIDARLRDAHVACRRADAHRKWLSALQVARVAQIEAGAWPGATATTWADVRRYVDRAGVVVTDGAGVEWRSTDGTRSLFRWVDGEVQLWSPRDDDTAVLRAEPLLLAVAELGLNAEEAS
jgi:hypothetical protein